MLQVNKKGIEVQIPIAVLVTARISAHRITTMKETLD